ncbi:MAG: two-component regulator propeller domain-containing protein [Bacteroidia bacterium]
MRQILNFSFLFFFFLFGNLFSQQFNFHNYSVREGIAQSQVYALLQDSRGYLWMGTRGGGITRYDGNGFKTYSVKDGLINNYVFCIKEDKNHNLLIGTNNGLSVYNGISFTNYSPSSDSMVWVQNIVSDKDGLMWLATNYGIITFDGKKFSNFSRQHNDLRTTIYTLYIDKQQNIWAGHSSGIAKIDRQGNIRHFTEKEGFKRNSVSCFTEDRKGNLWIGTTGDGAYVYDGNNFHRVDFQLELYKKTILDIYSDYDGNIWLSTLSDGVCKYTLTGGTFSWLSEKDGLANNHVRCVIRDNCGNYWFGTSGGGVSNYFGQQFTHYDKYNGLSGNFTYSVFKDSRGRIWCGASDKGVCYYDSSAFTCFGTANGFDNVKVKSICEDNNGTIYLGTDGQGLYAFNGTEFSLIPGLKKKFIRYLLKDDEGLVWCATAGSGIYYFNPSDPKTEIKNIDTKDGLPNNRINCLHKDKNNNIWFGTENHGMGLIRNKKVEKIITQKDGLPANSIRCIAEDNSGNIWVGSAGSGVGRYTMKSGIITRFDHTTGLTSSNIYLLSADNDGNIFSGTEAGLDKLVFNSGKELLEVKHYGKAEGFAGIETCQNAVYKEANGITWFGTINGLTKYDPANQTHNTHEPVTQLTDVRLFYESLKKTPFESLMGEWNSINGEIVLPYDQNHLTFDFIGINLSSPEGVKYQWKLTGFDENWSPPSQQRNVTYSNLAPGNYVFLLRASNEDGIWNSRPVELKFMILRPVWLRWWFIALCILILGAIVRSVFKWRLKQVKNKAEEQQHKLQMEKDLLELEQKALRLQMNPHFIFNALNSIQSQIGTDNEQSARYYLAKFSRLMRQILDNSRNTEITLEEEVNTLENYLLIEKFCNGERFDYSITVTGNIEKDYVKIPPMLLQPFVENAIKHGMKHISNKRGIISVTFEEKNNVLECTVSDNGIGRKKSEELNEKSKETYHRSTALLVTEERLSRMTAAQEINSPLEIIDLYNEQGEPEGTKVILRIPL